jgi:hypothetical protein
MHRILTTSETFLLDLDSKEGNLTIGNINADFIVHEGFKTIVFIALAREGIKVVFYVIESVCKVCCCKKSSSSV